ncbi:MAG: VOC family protein [Planctomycetota bacterium]
MKCILVVVLLQMVMLLPACGSPRAMGDASQHPMAAARMDHACLVTRDDERLIAWYRDVLGFVVEVHWEAPDVVPGARLSYLVHPSGFRLEIVGDPNAAPQAPAQTVPADFAAAGYRHLCFAVDDVDAARREMIARGAIAMGEPFDYPLLSRRLAFLQDPDGNVIEIVQPMAGAGVLPGHLLQAAHGIEGHVTVITTMQSRAGTERDLEHRLAAIDRAGAVRWQALRNPEVAGRYAIVQTWENTDALERHASSNQGQFETITDLLHGPPLAQLLRSSEQPDAPRRALPDQQETPLLDALRTRVRAAASLDEPFVLVVRLPMTVDGDATTDAAAWAHSIARATRAEPRNGDYAFFREADDHRAWVLLERWPEFAAMEEHVTLPHFGDLMRLLAAYGGDRRRAELYVPLVAP